MVGLGIWVTLIYEARMYITHRQPAPLTEALAGFTGLYSARTQYRSCLRWYDTGTCRGGTIGITIGTQDFRSQEHVSLL